MSTKAQQAIDKELTAVPRLVEAAADGGAADYYAGKRTNTRISEALQLEMTDDLSKKPVPVSMHNISETGCAFWLKRRLDLTTPIYVREFTAEGTAPWVPARVSHCTQGIRGYLIGVEFGEDKG